MFRERKISVIASCADRHALESFFEYISKDESIKTVGGATDGKEALKLILEKRPDIAVLDVMLKTLDGIGILEELRRRGVTETKCIIYSAVSDERVIAKALESGAVYYLIKPMSFSIITERIKEIGYEENYTDIKFESNTSEKNEDSPNVSELVIMKTLYKMSVKPSVMGYHYLKKGISMSVNGEASVTGITKCMYPEIAKEYKTSVSKVERAIRHALTSAWKNGGEKAYCNLLGIDTCRRPTNSQFIAFVSEYIKFNA